MQCCIAILHAGSLHDVVALQRSQLFCQCLSPGVIPEHKPSTQSSQIFGMVHVSFQDQVGRKVLLTEAALEEAIDNIRGAVMIAFPQGLPEWDLVRQGLEGSEELAGTSVSPLC